ncbi:MAG TPA: aquaporin Z [Candidatus Polarisedimenticolia bacterium]|nr:aquaporin Z [Candidatus Polarisedimenticolia bacterium]
MKESLAEFFGTMWFVLAGCGSAVLASGWLERGVGPLGVSVAFGLAILTMAYSIGPISGCHLNPAVTIGLWAADRFPGSKVRSYVLAQLLGGIAGGAVLCMIASGRPGFDTTAGFAANGYGLHSPGGYSLWACFVTEIVMAAVFLVIILGATGRHVPPGFPPIAVALGFSLIYLVSIPVTNGAVNPARSTGVGLFVGGWAVKQLWLFWIAPILGALLGAAAYRFLTEPAEGVKS